MKTKDFILVLGIVMIVLTSSGCSKEKEPIDEKPTANTIIGTKWVSGVEPNIFDIQTLIFEFTTESTVKAWYVYGTNSISDVTDGTYTYSKDVILFNDFVVKLFQLDETLFKKATISGDIMEVERNVIFSLLTKDEKPKSFKKMTK